VARVPGLRNKTIAITRSREEAREFFQLVKADGGRALAVPAIEIVPADRKVAQKFIASLEKKNHDYCAFMSAQAVRVLFDLAADAAGALKRTSVVAVGPKTKQELEKHGVKVDMVPDKFSSIGLVELLSGNDVKGKRIIIPRSGEANDFAAKALSGLGMKVDEIFLYRTRTAKVTSEWKEFGGLLAHGKVDAVVFTSASNVRSFFEIIKKIRKKMPKGVKAISIGPFTTAELAKRGIKCHEADDHTIKGTVKAAKKLLRARA
jgi:uroporphyrinogen-III synthase